jgi:arginine decarboxylase-like protein
MNHQNIAAQPWSIESARALYNIHRWGAKYFDINDAGHVVAMPLQEAGATVDITDVIEEAKGRGLKFPLLIRFQDILRHRVEAINQAFRSSIAEFNYQGKYRGVFPIKVNQLREVVEEILDAGKPYDFGLEVGSKPELFAGLAMQNQMGSLIICNGYKDADFIKMALLGIKLGKRVIMVVEKLEELRHIIRLQAARRGTADRHPRAAVEQGRGQMGGERRREREVRPEHGGVAGGDGIVEGGKPGALFQAAAFSHRLAGAGHFDGEKGGAGGGAVLREAAQDGFCD